MPRPHTLPFAAYDRILEVMRQRDAVPTDKELAKELNCSVNLVQKVMQRARKGRKLPVSRSTILDEAEAELCQRLTQPENTENADRI